MLKSINIKLDAEEISRISHFRPTSKSIDLIQKIFTKKHAFIVSAPYGSGKSLTSAFMLHLIENREASKKVLKEIAQKIDPISSDLSHHIQNRVSSSDKGLVIALYGYLDHLEHHLSDAIERSLKRVNIKITPSIRNLIEELSSEKGSLDVFSQLLKELHGLIDHLLIIWDEFGAHLEGLIENQKTQNLTKVQDLAALSVRALTQYGYPAHIFCLQHQSLNTYTEGQSHEVREEWAKVAGRFDTLQFIDDSKEVMYLLADIYEDTLKTEDSKVLSLPPSKIKPYLNYLYKALPHIQIQEAAFLELLKKTKHLSPLIIILLPLVSARVAQNERTLFDYLSNIQQKNLEVTLEHMYDYFEPLMRFDKSLGGTYRLYLLTNNILKNIDSEIERSIVKTSSLLSYALAGHQFKISKRLLELAVSGVTRFSSRAVKKSIQALIDKKLLLHKVYTDEIALWQGSNVDLESQLKKETHEVSLNFSMLDFLEKHYPLNYSTPIIYNHQKSIKRSIKNIYAKPEYLSSISDFIEEHLNTRTDCLVIYLVESEAKYTKVFEQLELLPQDLDQRVIFVISKVNLKFELACQEYEALQRLKNNEVMTGKDPIVVEELEELEKDRYEFIIDQAYSHFDIESETCFFFPRSRKIKISTKHLDYQEIFNQWFKETYSKTPVIKNEILNRTKVSSSSKNIRKKLISSILEHSTKPNLGFDEGYEGSLASSVQSIYRTLLLNTNFYRQLKGVWAFADVSELKDPLFAHFISLFKDFFQSSEGESIKQIDDFFTKLKSPPYGIRQGIIPVYFAATFKAYGKYSFLMEEGVYIEDVKPSDIEQLCKTPEKYQLRVLNVSPEREAYLLSIYQLFTSEPLPNHSQQLLRLTYDALMLWYQGLLDGPKKSKYVTKEAKKLRSIISRVKNPYELLFLNIPQWANLDCEDPLLIQRLSDFKTIIEGVEAEYFQVAVKQLTELMQLDSTSDVLWLDSIKAWGDAFPQTWISELDQVKAKIFLNTIRRPFDSREKLLNAITAGVFDLMLKRWSDDDLDRFKLTIQSLIEYIEAKALDKSLSGDVSHEHLPLFKNLIETRLTRYFEAYAHLTSKSQLNQFVKDFITKGALNGEDNT